MLDMLNLKLSQPRNRCQSQFPGSPRKRPARDTYPHPFLVFACSCGEQRGYGFAPPLSACGCWTSSKPPASAACIVELFLIPADLGGHGVTQVATRINELRKQGCVIDSRRVRAEDSFVTYFLRFAPERLKELPQDKPRPVSDFERRTRELEDTALPLFAGVRP